MEKPRLNVVTLGVTDFARAVALLSRLGFERRLKATGDDIAFFDAGGMVIGLFRWDMLAEDAQLPATPRPQAFRGITLAQMCRTDTEVDATDREGAEGRCDAVEESAEHQLRRLFRLLRRSGRHLWEAVRAPGFDFTDDHRVILPD